MQLCQKRTQIACRGKIRAATTKMARTEGLSICEEKKFMKDDCNFHEQKTSTRRS